MVMSQWKNVGGMFRMVLSGTNIKDQLANTIIDYTKLTSDNFAVINISGSTKTGYNTADGYAGATMSAFSPSYNSVNGILSFNSTSINAYMTRYTVESGALPNDNASAICSFSIILFCDIATCAK